MGLVAKGLPVPVPAGPLTSLALAGRPRAPPFDHDHARTLSQDETIDRCELRQ
jgi:hypothetical protein